MTEEPEIRPIFGQKAKPFFQFLIRDHWGRIFIISTLQRPQAKHQVIYIEYYLLVDYSIFFIKYY